MRPGYPALIAIVVSTILIALASTAQEPNDAEDVRRGDHCSTDEAARASSGSGRLSAMVLLQRQVASKPSLDGWVASEQEMNGSGHALPQISFMTMASQSRPRPSKLQTFETSNLHNDFRDGRDAGGKASSGRTASLDEQGYQAVARLRSMTNMETFIKRVIQDKGLFIVDEGSLKGMVPYYSGVKAKQSYKALTKEIAKALKNKRHPWLSTDPPYIPLEADEENEEINEENEEDEEDPAVGIAVLKKRPEVSKPHRRKHSLVQAEVSTVDGRPPRRHHRTDSLAQTKASTTSGSWILSIVAFLQSQAVYWLGARITLVACAGSLLFGLFMFDESAHQARASALLGESDAEDGLPPLPPMSPRRDGFLVDQRPGGDTSRTATDVARQLRAIAARAPAARVSSLKLPAAVLPSTKANMEFSPSKKGTETEADAGYSKADVAPAPTALTSEEVRALPPVDDEADVAPAPTALTSEEVRALPPVDDEEASQCVTPQHLNDAETANAEEMQIAGTKNDSTAEAPAAAAAETASPEQFLEAAVETVIQEQPSPAAAKTVETANAEEVQAEAPVTAKQEEQPLTTVETAKQECHSQVVPQPLSATS